MNPTILGVVGQGFLNHVLTVLLLVLSLLF